MPTKPPDRPAPTATRYRPPQASSHGSPDRSAALAGRLDLAPEVAEALAAGRPVVALESTLISHGLPYPRNVEVALASEAAIRESGAVPATVAIRDGRLIVGLDGEGVETLATARDVRKAARPRSPPPWSAVAGRPRRSRPR